MHRILIVLLLFQFALAQDTTRTKLPCQKLLASDSTHVDAPGLVDHLGVDATWVKEIIPPDSVAEWFHRRSMERAKEIWAPPPEADTTDPQVQQNRQHLQRILANPDRSASIADANEILQYYRPGDLIIYYSTPDNYWWSLSGQDGLLLLRNCHIIIQIILTQS